MTMTTTPRCIDAHEQMWSCAGNELFLKKDIIHHMPHKPFKILWLFALKPGFH